MELCDLTITDASNGLHQKKFSSRELTNACLKRIESVDGKINAFITTCADKAINNAEAADKRLSQNAEVSPLTGIPVAFKDNFSTEGIETTAGSNILKGFIPVHNATVVERVLQDGAVLIGKTNLDAFAHGSSTENSDFFVTHNPWDVERVPGGSSGGSTAALSSSECLFAFGSDTGGSVRQPAGFCNLVGLKPTYGLISRHGLIAMGSSVDCVGPITRTVEDCALVLNAITGVDWHDSVTADRKKISYTRNLDCSVKDLKIGLPKEYFSEGLDFEIKKVMSTVIEEYKNLGASFIDVSLPHTPKALAIYYILIPSEISANLARHDGIRYHHSALDAEWGVKTVEEVYEKTRGNGFGDEAKRRIMLGTYALSSGYYDAYYNTAMKVRTLVVREFEDVFKSVDCLLTPTSPTVPFKIGEKTSDPLTMYLADTYTVPASIAGIPALNIPAGFVQGLPVGAQLIGPQFSEERLLQLGHAYQNVTDWHKKRPQLELSGR